MKTIQEQNATFSREQRPVKVHSGKHVGYGFIDHLARINREAEEKNDRT